jgi:uncharacterized membrane protein YidH (DUF202 family)
VRVVNVNEQVWIHWLLFSISLTSFGLQLSEFAVFVKLRLGRCQRLVLPWAADVASCGLRFLGPGHTKETGNRRATVISERRRRFQVGNWFPY